VVKDWLRRHPEFELEPLPTYSPNLNLIERLWKFLRQRALSRWHKTFEAMQAAVADVLDHLSDYRKELGTLMTEKFQIMANAAIPVEYGEVAWVRARVLTAPSIGWLAEPTRRGYLLILTSYNQPRDVENTARPRTGFQQQ
jgi:hypothetical protein